MIIDIEFPFRNKIHGCDIYIDSSAYPCFVFVTHADQELIDEFGEDVTIKTDCLKLLRKKDDYPRLIELRLAIFEVVKLLPAFATAKQHLTKFTPYSSPLVAISPSL